MIFVGRYVELIIEKSIQKCIPKYKSSIKSYLVKGEDELLEKDAVGITLKLVDDIVSDVNTYMLINSTKSQHTM